MGSEIFDLVELIKRFEGCRLTPYRCPAGVWTVGFGATGWGVIPGQKWTQEQADERLQQDAIKTLTGASRLVPGVSGGTLVALSDFAFNCGLGALKTSTLRRKVLAGDMDAARVEIMRWTRAGGKVLNGLVRRRAAEAALLT